MATSTKSRIVATGTMDKVNNQTSIAQAIAQVAPPVVQTPTVNYTDPQDALDTHLEFHPEFHGRLASAMAFTIDKAILRQAKTVLYAQWGHIKGTPEMTFNMYCMSVRDAFSHDSLYEEDGPLRTMAQLMAVREQWHDVAGNLIGLAYDPTGLPDQVRADNLDALAKSVELAPDLVKVHRINAEFWCDGDATEVEQFLKDILTNKQNTVRHWAEADKLIEPTILEIISIVGRHINHATRFEDLPARTRSSLMQSCINSTKKMVLKETERMRGQEIAQARLNQVARRIVTSLESSIVKQFSDAGELENVASQSSIDHARAQKRVAWNTY